MSDDDFYPSRTVKINPRGLWSVLNDSFNLEVGKTLSNSCIMQESPKDKSLLIPTIGATTVAMQVLSQRVSDVAAIWSNDYSNYN